MDRRQSFACRSQDLVCCCEFALGVPLSAPSRRSFDGCCGVVNLALCVIDLALQFLRAALIRPHRDESRWQRHQHFLHFVPADLKLRNLFEQRRHMLLEVGVVVFPLPQLAFGDEVRGLRLFQGVCDSILPPEILLHALAQHLHDERRPMLFAFARLPHCRRIQRHLEPESLMQRALKPSRSCWQDDIVANALEQEPVDHFRDQAVSPR